MSGLEAKELHFLLDRDGGLIAYQERDASWAGILAFSNEEQARSFCRESGFEACEIAAIAGGDREALATLIREIKPRAARYLFVDLDYRHGHCIEVELVGDGLGEARERQFEPRQHS